MFCSHDVALLTSWTHWSLHKVMSLSLSVWNSDNKLELDIFHKYNLYCACGYCNAMWTVTKTKISMAFPIEDVCMCLCMYSKLYLSTWIGGIQWTASYICQPAVKGNTYAGNVNISENSRILSKREIQMFWIIFIEKKKSW